MKRILVLSMAIVFTLLAAASAQTPPNDDCLSVVPENLIPGSPLTWTGNNIGATEDCRALLDPAVWHGFTTAEPLNITIDYCGTSPAFQNVNLLLMADCNCQSYIWSSSYDNTSCGDSNWTIHFSVPAGTWYFPVLTRPGSQGPYTIHVVVEGATPPANDDCANAIPIGDVTNLSFSTTNATPEGNSPCMAFSRDIWYLYTATCNGPVNVDLCGSTFDTKLAVFNGNSCDPLPTEYLCNDDSYNYCGPERSYQSILTFTGVAGNQYLIEVGGYGNITGDGDITIFCTAPVFEIDPDSLLGIADSGRIDAETLTVRNTGVGDLNFAISITRDTLLPPPINGGYGGYLTAAEIPAEKRLSARRASDDSFSSELEKRSKPVDRIAFTPVVEKDKDAGIAPLPNPKVILQGGDDIYSATPIMSLPFSDSGTTVGFTNDYDGDCGDTGAPDVVYSYTPGSNQLVSVSLCGSLYDTKIYVFENNPRVIIGCNDDYCGFQSQINALSFNAGNTYYIVVDGFGSQAGSYFLNVSEAACTADIIVSLPASLPYTDFNSTCPYSNDYSNTCLGEFDEGNDVIYELTVASDICIDILLDPQNTPAGIALDYACPPDPANCIAVSTNSGGFPCGFSGLSLSAGTYYLMIDNMYPPTNCIRSYELLIRECLPPPQNDSCQNAEQIAMPYPQTVYGANVGATIDCPGVLDWNAVWYKFDVPYAYNNISLDYCPTPGSINTIGLILYADCGDCSAYIIADGLEWNLCSNNFINPRVQWLGLPGPATYYLPVFANGVDDFGFTIDVTEIIPCRLECPPESIHEIEICGDESNDGCNMVVPAFEPIVSNSVVCGTAWSDRNIRDTDWYLLTLNQTSLLSLSGVAEFPLTMLIFNPGSGNCFDYEPLTFGSADPCSTLTLTAELPAGNYWLFVAPSVWSNQPCDGSAVFGNNYYFSIMSNSPWLAADIGSGTISAGDSMKITVLMDATGLNPGQYRGNIHFTTNDPFRPTADVPVGFSVTAPSGCAYIPGDINGNGVANGIDVIYGVGFFKGGPVPPVDCFPVCPAQPNPFYGAGDVNGSCLFNGIDITYFVAYLKGSQPALNSCPACPPAGGLAAPAVVNPSLVPRTLENRISQ